MMRSMANTGLLRRISNYRHLRRTGAHVHANEPVYSFSKKCFSTQFINGDADGDTLTSPLEESNRTSLLFELKDRIGVLHNVLRFFWKYDVNVTRIESRPSKFGKFDFFVDLEGTIGDENVDRLLRSLKGDSVGIRKILILDEKQGE